MNTIDILRAIPSTEPATYNEFLNALPDCPSKGDTTEWRELLQTVQHLESIGLVEVDRGYNNRINSLQLTAEGAQQVRDNGDYRSTGVASDYSTPDDNCDFQAEIGEEEF